MGILGAFHRLLLAFFKEFFTRSIWGEYLYATNEYITWQRTNVFAVHIGNNNNILEIREPYNFKFHDVLQTAPSRSPRVPRSLK